MQDFVKALQWYRCLEKRLDEDLKKSNRRDINKLVQLGLGLLYEYGGGVEQDYQKALGRYKNLADNNMTVGYHQLGLMYYYGKGVSVNYSEALSLFEKAFSARIKWETRLPYVYIQTDLHKNDTQRNLVFCTPSNLDIRGEAFYYLRMMHRNEQGVSQDEEKAQGYFRQALAWRCKRAKFEIIN
jgi:TPR repeat protein